MPNIALIDSDELAYKLALHYQKKFYTVYKDDKVLWRTQYKEEAIESIGNRDDLEIGEGIEVYDLKDYKEKIDSTVNHICASTNSDGNYKLLLSGDNNFRYSIATLLPYKGNRVPKPYHLESIRAEYRERGAESVDYLEADDLLAYYATVLDYPVICSSDKDLKTVPSLNFDINQQKLRRITKEEADYNFYYQLLIGDAVDNIPSPYGLGPVRAKDILENSDPSNYYQSILPEYIKYLTSKKGKTNEYKTSWYSGQDVHEVLYEIGNLLWMHRTTHIDERWRVDG